MTSFVFIHGKGDPKESLSAWRPALAQRLWDAGIPAPDSTSERWVEVRYDDLLKNWPAYQPDPWPEVHPVLEEAYQAFRVRRAALEDLASRPPSTGGFERINGVASAAIKAVPLVVGAAGGPGGNVVGAAVSNAMAQSDVDIKGQFLNRMSDVVMFATDETLRQAVVHRILDGMPEGDVVVVAHSLGSVAVLEALPYLSPGTSIRLLVTIGSPAALVDLRVHTRLAGDKVPFPCDRVGLWLNLVNEGDPVTMGTGLRDHFPLVVDHAVPKVYSRSAEAFHGVRMYLSDPIVSHALRLTVEVPPEEVLEGAIDVDDDQLPAVISLMYARFIAGCTEDDERRSRCEAAIERRLLPALRDRVNPAVSEADAQRSLIAWKAKGQSPTACKLLLLLTALSDPFSPFDPDVGEKERRKGLQRLANQLALAPTDAHDVWELVEAAGRVASGTKRVGPLSVQRGFRSSDPLDTRTVAGVAAGTGLSGGAAEPVAFDDLDDEGVMTQVLARRAAVIRLLRGLSDSDAQQGAQVASSTLAAIEEEVLQLSELHADLSHGKAHSRALIDANLRRVRRVREWLAEKEPADRQRAGMPEPDPNPPPSRDRE